MPSAPGGTRESLRLPAPRSLRPRPGANRVFSTAYERRSALGTIALVQRRRTSRGSRDSSSSFGCVTPMRWASERLPGFDLPGDLRQGERLDAEPASRSHSFPLRMRPGPRPRMAPRRCPGQTSAAPPIVLSQEEVAAILRRMEGTPRLMASLVYGSGLRLLQCARLRVKDVDFQRREITVRDGKGQKDRVTMIPARLLEPLGQQIERTREQHARDVRAGAGYVELPDSLQRKYPYAAREWAWQWVFPATRFYVTSRDLAIAADITSTSPSSSAPSRTPFAWPALPSRQALTSVRDSSPRKRLRHPNHPGAPRPQRPEHHYDLHPRSQSRKPWRHQPTRPAWFA